MMQKDTAIGKDLDRGTRLVEVDRRREADAKLGWTHADATFLPLVVLIKLVHLRSSFHVVALFPKL